MDRALADEFGALEQAARSMGYDVLGDALRAAGALAHQGDHGTLARIGGLLSAATLTEGPTFHLLFAASRALVHRVGVTPVQVLRRYLVDELVAALGRKTLELDEARDALEAAEGERDAALVRLRDAACRPGLECCHAAMAEALAQHSRAAHPAVPALRAPSPANDAGASAQ